MGIDTEDYSLHVEQALVPLSQQGDIFSDVSTFNNFPPIILADGKKMKFKVKCDSYCIKYWSISKNNDGTVPGSTNEHIIVKVEKVMETRTQCFGGLSFMNHLLHVATTKGNSSGMRRKRKVVRGLKGKTNVTKKRQSSTVLKNMMFVDILKQQLFHLFEKISKDDELDNKETRGKFY